MQYRTHTKWKPGKLRVLFIAESAPGTSEGYFYGLEYREGYGEILCNNLLDLLQIDRNNIADALIKFKERGYFLSDGVKCRCDKGGKTHPPPVLAANCGRNWLGREIELLNPEKICTLGNTAIEALEVVHGYKALTGMTAGRNCGAIVNAARPVLLWVFPSDRTSIYSRGKEDLFRQFTMK